MNNWYKASLAFAIGAVTLIIASQVYDKFFVDTHNSGAALGAVLMDIEAIVIGSILLVVAMLFAIVGYIRKG